LKTDKSGHLYVITCAQYRQEEIYQIGQTNNIQKCLRNINRLNKDKMMLEINVYSDNCHQLEKLVHEVLEEYHIEGDFFKCDLNLIKTIVQKLQSCNVQL
jgi:hypothetical protein